MPWYGHFPISPLSQAFKRVLDGHFDAFAAKLVYNAHISVQPGSWDYGETASGSSSPPKAFIVSNTGTDDLQIGSVGLQSSNATDFRFARDDCSERSLAGQEICTVEIIFSPTSSGTEEASLSIPSNDPDKPHLSVTLVGKTTSGLKALPAASPASGYSPLNVRFTTAGKDLDGTIQVYRWDFDGNGVWDTYDTVANDYTRTYSRSGTYKAVLMVQSSTGKTATATVSITVQNRPPTATADVLPSNGAAPLMVQLKGSSTDLDGTIVLYEWDTDGDGIFEYSSPTTPSTTHLYQVPGTYQAVFRVTDNEGASTTATAIVTEVRVGTAGSPTATAAASPSIGPAPLKVNFSGTGKDPDGAIVNYEWDFENDGIYDYASPVSGTVSHVYTEPGEYVAAFRVTGNDGKTGVDLIQVTATLSVNLLLGDSDKTVNPTQGELMPLSIVVNGSIPASVLIKNQEGRILRTLPVSTPTAASARLDWDGRDDGGLIVNDGLYYAVLRYFFEGEWKDYDLTSSTGAQLRKGGQQLKQKGK